MLPLLRVVGPSTWKFFDQNLLQQLMDSTFLCKNFDLTPDEWYQANSSTSLKKAGCFSERKRRG